MEEWHRNRDGIELPSFDHQDRDDRAPLDSAYERRRQDAIRSGIASGPFNYVAGPIPTLPRSGNFNGLTFPPLTANRASQARVTEGRPLAAPQLDTVTTNLGVTGHLVPHPAGLGTNVNAQITGQFPPQGNRPHQLLADQGTAQQGNSHLAAGPLLQNGTPPPNENLLAGKFPRLS
jgi:hypothetical protein